MKYFFINGCKGILTLVCASLVFITVLVIFALFGALISKGFPLGQILSDNLNLLVILNAVNIPLGFFLGSIAGKLRQKRIFFLSLLGFIFYWLLLVLIILAYSESGHSLNLYSGIISLSLRAMLAYSFYAVPFIIAAVFLLEKWTRRK